MFPLLPLLLLLVVWGLFTLLQRYWPRRPAAATAAFLGALAVLCATQAVGKHREFIAITDTRNVLTQWIADNVPPDRTVTVLDSIQLHPDAARLTGASIQTASLADREILLGADWLVLPTFEADAKTEREELADLTRELIAQGRKIVWRRGNRDISSAASFSRPPRMRLQVYGPAARSTQQR